MRWRQFNFGRLPSMKTVLRALAKEHGFADCRFARAVEAPHAAEYMSWLQSGKHGDMTWLERDPARRTARLGSCSTLGPCLSWLPTIFKDLAHANNPEKWLATLGGPTTTKSCCKTWSRSTTSFEKMEAPKVLRRYRAGP